ncbi:MAG: hypothetical protein FWC99_04420 [Coriobacteriia bacterium]|nr:hypothetical protein [Coriobacteriia bacterium]
MGDNRNQDKLLPNDKTSFRVCKRSWDIGKCEPITIEGCEGYLMQFSQPAQRLTSLEVNFFSTELMDVLPEQESLAHFMEKYGLLDCPYRESSIPLIAMSELRPAIRKTDRARKHIWGEMIKKSVEIGSPIVEPTNYKVLPTHFVSHDEAMAVLMLLQDTVRGLTSSLDRAELRDFSEDFQDPRLFDFVNMNASNSEQAVYINEEQQEVLYDEGIILAKAVKVGSLVSAISNQIIETVADSVSWYRCKAPDCKRWFKRKRGSKSPRPTSEYCSTTCRSRLKQQKRRKNKADTSTK